MHELLFRAWYKNEPYKFVQKTIKDEIFFVMQDDDDCRYPFYIPFIDSDWIVEQYTGEKCYVTGSDLYEGDIMERNLELFVIEFSHGEFVCRSFEKPNVSRSLCLFTSVTTAGDAGAKIGNIHDQKEDV